MIGPKRAGPGRAHAEDDDLVLQELDAGRAAGDARPAVEVAADGGLPHDGPVKLAQCQRHARSGRPAREPHGFERVAGRDGVARRFGTGDPFGREQRAFDLDVVGPGRARDLGFGERPPDSIRHGLDLGAAADLPGFERRGASTPYCERGAELGSGRAGLEDRPVRGESAFGATGHDEGNVASGGAKMVLEEVAERQGGETAAEIVDAAIALGLAEDGHDAFGLDATVGDGSLDRRGVVRRAGAQPVDVGLAHGPHTGLGNS
jgi:hypothetical protein